MKKSNRSIKKDSESKVLKNSKMCLQLICKAIAPTDSVPPPKKKKNYDSKK